MRTITLNYCKKTAVIFVIGIAVFCASSAIAMTNNEIDATLSNYNEAGYKFVDKPADGMWKVLYSRPGWEFGWEVVVAATAPDPDQSLIVIGTTIVTVKKVPVELMLRLLDENSYDTNPGAYSIFKEQDGTYSIQYAIKIPQSLVEETLIKEGIGFVAGYSNNRLKELEKLIPKEDIIGNETSVETGAGTSK